MIELTTRLPAKAETMATQKRIARSALAEWQRAKKG